tara:strand:- start:6 stop:374 length:369 start_codon:yes stop_codon:yes gene_type:complete
MKCSRCDIVVPRGRIDMGYTICIECSTEEKVSCHTIYPHKTGGYIQVVSKEQSERMNKLDRRGSSAKSSKHYKEFVVKEREPVKVGLVDVLKYILLIIPHLIWLVNIMTNGVMRERLSIYDN